MTRLRTLREGKGLSWNCLTWIIGLPWQTIQALEDGSYPMRDARPEDLERLEAELQLVLGIDLTLAEMLSP